MIQLGQQQLRNSNSLDRCWQRTPGPPEKSTQHQGPVTGDLEGHAEREKRGRGT